LPGRDSGTSYESDTEYGEEDFFHWSKKLKTQRIHDFEREIMSIFLIYFSMREMDEEMHDSPSEKESYEDIRRVVYTCNNSS
jgi:hypothetical protein